jgi:hypothetical protein
MPSPPWNGYLPTPIRLPSRLARWSHEWLRFEIPRLTFSLAWPRTHYDRAGHLVAISAIVYDDAIANRSSDNGCGVLRLIAGCMQMEPRQPNSHRLPRRPLLRECLTAVACAATTIFLIGGCQHCPKQTSDGFSQNAGDTVMVRTELYFGLSKHGGGEIAGQDFDAFINEVVTPRFPDGLTIVDAIGQWRDSNGQFVHEKTKLLIVLHPASVSSAQAIEEIRSQYKFRFGEESVMRVTSSAAVAF